jgi:hypothetical protein
MLVAFLSTVLTVVIVGLMTGFAGATPVLLVPIIFLLFYQQFRKRDFYVVEHFVYDLNFIEAPGSYGKTWVRVERGPMVAHGCRAVGFWVYAAAKASFDCQEDLHASDPMAAGTEAIHRVYVVSASRKPANTLLKDDNYRQTLLHETPYPIKFARRKEAAEECLVGIENERASSCDVLPQTNVTP